MPLGPGTAPLTLRRYMLEEAYEAVEAASADDSRRLCEDLGDVLLQVVFHAQLARERGDFAIDDVVSGITAKLIRRHPHVFGDVRVSGAADVVRNWQAIKAAEKGEGPEPRTVLAGVDRGQPALSRAAALQKKAAEVGFDWPDPAGAMDKVQEELAEVGATLAAGSPLQMEQEVDDLLFAAVNVARLVRVDPEMALTAAVAKFVDRFTRMKTLAWARGQDLASLPLAAPDQLWEEAKGAEK